MLKKGNLIVIEGSDGIGKTTQLELLEKYLLEQELSVETIDFPRYRDSFHGRTIRRYLDGEFGELDKVSPYLISLAYSLDRATARNDIRAWLREGKIVLANRYAPSNMAHQAAKLPEKERDKFVAWDHELEYKVNKIPKEDLVIFLYVPVRVTQKLIKQRGGKLDLHERNLDFLTESERMYLKLARKFKHWIVVNCVNEKGGLRSKEDIHREVTQILKKKKIF